MEPGAGLDGSYFLRDVCVCSYHKCDCSFTRVWRWWGKSSFLSCLLGARRGALCTYRWVWRGLTPSRCTMGFKRVTLIVSDALKPDAPVRKR